VLRLITDEDLNIGIIRGVIRRIPYLDLVRAADVGLLQTPDPVILDWAAREGRIIVTHDVNTMTRHAYDRIRTGTPMSGLIVLPQSLPIGAAIEELVTLIACSRDEEWDGRVLFLPL
jgi:hypothetical protein